MVARVAPFIRVAGRLERRDANMNVVVDRLGRLDRPDLPLADVRPIEPPVQRETGRVEREGADTPPAELPAAAAAGGGMAELGAALPAPHSFGRRGR